MDTDDGADGLVGSADLDGVETVQNVVETVIAGHGGVTIYVASRCAKHDPVDAPKPTARTADLDVGSIPNSGNGMQETHPFAGTTACADAAGRTSVL